MPTAAVKYTTSPVELKNRLGDMSEETGSIAPVTNFFVLPA